MKNIFFNFLKLLTICVIPLNCYSQQLSDIPTAVMQKVKNYCNSLNRIDYFSDSYIFDLANRQQMDPSTIRVYKVEFSPLLFKSNDDNTNFNLFTGRCNVTFAHAKGVHYDSFRIPTDLDYKYNIVSRKPTPPQEDSKKDYSSDYPNLYTPPGFIRNKRGALVYY
jgi:hypothetical protein